MGINTGRNIGRLSIRVIPDTTRFRKELKRRLDIIEKGESVGIAIEIDKAKLNKAKIREDIRRQMNELRGVKVDVMARVSVDSARLKKATLRKNIQDQFDKFDNIRVNIEAVIKNAEHFEKEVRDMVGRAERNKVKLQVNAATAAASAQMKWVSRDRIVNLIVKVSKASVATALTSLAALSGARLSWKWIDDLISKFKELDRNLPAIVGWTTGITSLIASLFAATSGLVGIGQGLFAITPALLVLPGLLLNALGSATALIVALRNANKELSPLKDEMSELGDIINADFWGKARQPILNLVSGLMPQLRNAFSDLSSGVGEFAGAMSDAFGKELANGRLESIFKGIADGWRVLGSGADGFAGALVSLSNIAATYTPRLAHWFVRQANTFDKWLKAISEDGRLGAWMEDAIDAMYDVWDVTRGLAGVFSGLWKAADQAGSGGLHGFGQLMLEWRRTVHSADFQRGLTAVFRGSYVAMEAFGDAIKGIGRLISDNSKAFETFIGSAGKFLGGLIEGIADALNTPLVATGMDALSSGLVDALNGVLPHLPRIADTFGNFLGLLGELARTLLPTAAGVLEDLMPIIDSVMAEVERVLPDLGQALSDISSALAPAIKSFVDAAGPLFVDAISTLADALVDLVPAIASLVEVLAALIEALNVWTENNKGMFNDLADTLAGDNGKSRRDREALLKLDKITPTIDMDNNPLTIDARLDLLWDQADVAKSAREIADRFMAGYKETLTTKGQGAADALLNDFRQIKGLPPEVIKRIEEQLAAGFRIPDLKGPAAKEVDGVVKEIQSAFKSGGKESAEEAWKNLVMGGNGKPIMTPELRRYVLDGLRDLGVELDNGAKDVSDGFSDRLAEGLKGDRSKWRESGDELAGALMDGINSVLGGGLTGGGGGVGGAGGGFSFSRSFAQGITDGKPEVTTAAGGLASAALEALSGASTLLTPAGGQVAGGLQAGIVNGIPGITTTLTGLAPIMQGALSGARSWLNPQGQAAAGGLADGINSGRGNVSGAAGGLRGAVVGAVQGISLYGIGQSIAGGLAAGISSQGGLIAGAARAAVNNAVSAARRAAEVNSPSKKMIRMVGKPLGEGVAVGIDRSVSGIRKSMAAAVDLADVGGTSPRIGGTGGGNQIYVTQPLLPGETPSEQRDNLVRELRWAI